MTQTLTLTKHHGLGNDFLILVDLAEHVPVASRAELARYVCARHRGVGADGLLLALPPPADRSAAVTMRLHNADGSVAEMSGNGIRCFAQAVIMAGVAQPGTIRVATDAGVRVVDAGPTDALGLAKVRVAMGEARLGAIAVPREVAARLDGGRYSTVDLGNPHLVVDQRMLGASEVSGGWSRVGGDLMAGLEELEKPFLATPTNGINVEAIWPEAPVPDAVVGMRVWERGVGLTEACGTGACASAVVAREWGWCGDRVTVRQPGGDAVVELNGDDVTLIGPTQYIAAVTFPWVS